MAPRKQDNPPEHDRPHEPAPQDRPLRRSGAGRTAYVSTPTRLRLRLAGLGLVFCVIGIVAFTMLEFPAWSVAFLALVAVLAVVDIAVLLRRRRAERS